MSWPPIAHGPSCAPTMTTKWPTPSLVPTPGSRPSNLDAPPPELPQDDGRLVGLKEREPFANVRGLSLLLMNRWTSIGRSPLSSPKNGARAGPFLVRVFHVSSYESRERVVPEAHNVHVVGVTEDCISTVC